MSKRSLFWGQGSGKLGEAVYYRAGGEQRTRTYVKTVKNPKSYLQAVQRTKFNNMIAVYKGLEVAVKSFWTKRNANQSAFNAFFKCNWPINRWVASDEDIRYREGCMEGFYVSNGTLSVPTQLAVESWRDDESNTYYGLVMTVAATNIALPQGDKNMRYLNTGAKMYQALVGEMNPYGLPAEFTVALVNISSGAVNMNANIFTIKCSANSVEGWKIAQLGAGRDVPSQKYLDELVEAVDGDFTDPASAPGSIEGVTKLSVAGRYDTEDTLGAGAALVVSFKDASGVQTTRSAIVCGQGLDSYIQGYAPDGEYGAQIVSDYQIVNNLIE